MRKIFRKEEGFTLIDVIVTIAIVLALAVGGFVSYGNLAEQAKRAVTEAAAQQVYDAANVFNQEGSKTPQEASEEFNRIHETVTTSVTGENCVLAIHEDGHESMRGTGCAPPPEEEPPAGPVVGRTLVESQFMVEGSHWDEIGEVGTFTVTKNVESLMLDVGRGEQSASYSRPISGGGEPLMLKWIDESFTLDEENTYIVNLRWGSQSWSYEVETPKVVQENEEGHPHGRFVADAGAFSLDRGGAWSKVSDRIM